jgi:hypothetical protein
MKLFWTPAGLCSLSIYLACSKGFSIWLGLRGIWDCQRFIKLVLSTNISYLIGHVRSTFVLGNMIQDIPGLVPAQSWGIIVGVLTSCNLVENYVMRKMVQISSWKHSFLLWEAHISWRRKVRREAVSFSCHHFYLFNDYIRIAGVLGFWGDRKSTRLNSSHVSLPQW